MCEQCGDREKKSGELLKEFFEEKGLKENAVMSSDVLTTSVEVEGGIWLIQKSSDITQVCIDGSTPVKGYISAVFIHDDMALDISLALAMTQPPEALMARLFGTSED
ncbi:hypothetical protein SEA_CASSEROLE_44 [Arthrobacter phage Casserole]|nr:hypothetical protein SEA_CASSEROLE_44 [Arthrobacter phage Casserole]